MSDRKERHPKDGAKEPAPGETREALKRSGKAGRPMTKGQLAARLAADVGTDERSAGKFLDALAKVVREELLTNPSGQFVLPGIATVLLRHMPGRRAMNPFTKEEFVLPGKTVLRFRPATPLKSAASALAAASRERAPGGSREEPMEDGAEE